ncbi:MAG: TetR/AcrR family transcriptional regulator [Pseudomonadales bacterium]|nr:TetR/AcrR family transcriptional regulator [Pseudomonadales bacterium]
MKNDDVGTVHINVAIVNLTVYDRLMSNSLGAKSKSAVSSLPPKPYHHGDLQHELLCAARTLLEENNIASLSLRAVAKKVGVSHTAPYRHFKDKESLLAGIAIEGFIELTAQLTQAAALHPDDPAAQLLEAGQRYVQLVLDNPQCVQLMFGGILPCDDTYPKLQEYGDGAFAAVKGIIEKGQTQGVFRKGDIELMALTAWSGIHGLSLLFISGSLNNAVSSTLEVHPLTTAVTALMMNGLKSG